MSENKFVHPDITRIKNVKKYIYESPDKGKTIYRREFGNYK